MLGIVVEFACQHEEVVAESVRVGDDLRVNFCSFFAKGEDAPFCASAYGAAYVAHGGSSASSRQDEVSERWQDCVDAVNLLLNGSNHVGGDDVAGTHGMLTVVCGQIASYDEEVVLDGCEEQSVVLVGAIGDEHSDV